MIFDYLVCCSPVLPSLNAGSVYRLSNMRLMLSILSPMSSSVGVLVMSMACFSNVLSKVYLPKAAGKASLGLSASRAPAPDTPNAPREALPTCPPPPKRVRRRRDTRARGSFCTPWRRGARGARSLAGRGRRAPRVIGREGGERLGLSRSGAWARPGVHSLFCCLAPPSASRCVHASLIHECRNWSNGAHCKRIPNSV